MFNILLGVWQFLTNIVSWFYVQSLVLEDPTCHEVTNTLCHTIDSVFYIPESATSEPMSYN